VSWPDTTIQKAFLFIPNQKLIDVIKKYDADEVVFSYSDVTYDHVMHVGALVNAAGASFVLASPTKTMIDVYKPVVSVCAVRTGCGKSQTSRVVSDILTNMGKKVVSVRHPMPYGDLKAQKGTTLCQTFRS
jgi:predicted GTPase